MSILRGKMEVKTFGIQNMMLGSPADHLCQVCAGNHKADDPHDCNSLFYQYAFYKEYSRWPTWKDAVAHCSEGTQKLWENELRGLGLWPISKSAE